MLEFDKLDSVLDTTEAGEPVAYDIQFQSDVKVFKTVHVKTDGDGDVHIYVDLDDENIPIAMSFVHAPTAVIYKKIGEPQKRKAVSDAYALASQIAMWANSFVSTSFSVEQLLSAERVVNGAARRMRQLEESHAMAQA